MLELDRDGNIQVDINWVFVSMNGLVVDFSLILNMFVSCGLMTWHYVVCGMLNVGCDIEYLNGSDAECLLEPIPDILPRNLFK